MKNLIDFNAKIIRNSVEHGDISEAQRKGLMILHDFMVFAAYDAGSPQDVREHAWQQLTTLPPINPNRR